MIPYTHACFVVPHNRGVFSKQKETWPQPEFLLFRELSLDFWDFLSIISLPMKFIHPLHRKVWVIASCDTPPKKKRRILDPSLFYFSNHNFFNLYLNVFHKCHSTDTHLCLTVKVVSSPISLITFHLFIIWSIRISSFNL